MFRRDIHRLRGLALVLILVIHAVRLFDHSVRYPIFLPMSMLGGNATVLFLFISGYLFRHLSDRFRPRAYLVRKLRYVMAPYLLWSLPAVALALAGLAEAPRMVFADYPAPVQALLLLVTGQHLLPFWFLPTLFLFYLCGPLFIRLDRDGRVYWLLPLLVVLSVVVPRDMAFPPQSFVHLFSVYLAGMYCSRYRVRVLDFVGRYGWLIASLVLGLVAWEYAILDVWRHNPLNFLHKLLLCPLLLWVLDRVPVWGGRLLDYLAGISFGLFFVHYYWIRGFQLVLGRDGLPLPDVPLAALYVTALLLVSVATVEAVRRLSGRYSRMVVGC